MFIINSPGCTCVTARDKIFMISFDFFRLERFLPTTT